MTCFTVNRLSGTIPGWHISNVLASIDQYGLRIPTFTLKGQNLINTAIGGFLTIITFITVSLFGATKILQLVYKSNPTISSFKVPDAIDPNEIVNIGDTNFRFAFSLEAKNNRNKNDYNHKNDAKFLRWVVRNHGKRNGEFFENILPFHRCTADDMKGFYPISS